MLHLFFAFAIAMGFIWAFVVFRSFRIAASILALIVGGLIFVAQQNATEEEKKHEAQKEKERVTCEAEKKATAEADKKNWTIIRPAQVQVRDMLLTPPVYGNEYGVTASIKNLSAINVSKIKMNVVAYDCPDTAPNFAQCDVVGHEEKEYYSNVPAGELRQLKGAVTLRDAPKPRGTFSWSYRVLGVKADPNGSDDDFLAKWVRCGE
jgi:hypothetical protein